MTDRFALQTFEKLCQSKTSKYLLIHLQTSNYGFFIKIVAIKQQNNEYVSKKRQKACEGYLTDG